ncbi:MAG: hypothetical protein V4700_05225 [Pseudomonadota bacterium]
MFKKLCYPGIFLKVGTGPASECTFFAGLRHKKKSHSLSPLPLFNFCSVQSTLSSQQNIKDVTACYKDEIQHLDEGGNLGVASDILLNIGSIA